MIDNILNSSAFQFLINLKISELFSFLALIISILGTLIIPWLKNDREQQQLQKELNNYKYMLENEYITVFSNQIDKLLKYKAYEFYATDTPEVDPINDDLTEIGKVHNKLKEIISIKTDSLSFTLNSELPYLSSKNQFKLIRMTTITNQYFLIASAILNISSNKLDQRKTEKLRLKEIKKLTELYLAKIDDYADFKTDYLLTYEEASKIYKKIENAEVDVHKYI